MIIIGIDPGTATTGYGILEKKAGGAVIALDWGIIATDKSAKPEARLATLAKDLRVLLQKYKPQRAVVEELYFEKNLKTAIAVAAARGVILLTLEERGVRIDGLTPLQVKSRITGYGKATKQQMQFMVKTLLKLSEKPRPDDAADALALALSAPSP